MVDADYTVIFEKNAAGSDVSRSVDHQTGETQYFARRNNVYEVELMVAPYGTGGGNLHALGDDANMDDWGPLAAPSGTTRRLELKLELGTPAAVSASSSGCGCCGTGGAWCCDHHG